MSALGKDTEVWNTYFKPDAQISHVGSIISHTFLYSMFLQPLSESLLQLYTVNKQINYHNLCGIHDVVYFQSGLGAFGDKCFDREPWERSHC